MDKHKELLLDSYKEDGIHPDNTLAENILKKHVAPLRPNITEIHEIPAHCGDIKTRQNELTSRLSNALAKLKQYKQRKDANWSLDYSLLDVKDDFSVKDAKLPRHVEENIKGIVDSAQEYIGKLEEQLQELNCADQQIERSSEKTLKDIDETYQALVDDVCREINLKRHLLRMETEVYKNEGLAPLKACRQEVNAQIQSTHHLIHLIETMLSHPHTFTRDRLGKIVAASSNMGRIPAVPLLEELPYVTFSRPTKCTRDELLAKFSELGCVLRMGPAQLSDIEERPASLFVKWFIADPDYAAEEQTFIVQKAPGEVLDPASNAFETVYEGSESSCFIRDLPVNEPVTLRVGIQVTDTAWSVHRISKTTIPAYSWVIDNKNYMITNSGKIAAKITDQINTLLSDGPQFNTDHIIEFKFLEASQDGNDSEGVALVFDPEGCEDTLKRPGALLITPHGKIFIDGEEKLMKLPKMRFGTRIAFTAERKDKDTLRINIECADKAVTYDWTVQTPLHFAIRFTEYNKWNILVK
ncbi:uncharacterized protein LOC107265605 isoform X2 [Cephus cinctus]|nr:uncharacterized protein LOC107265605 isoform X2 [Cephus cinctus]XP_015590696.1 uncharacterized protein LOC107265605 isoform X2 [Cephus cinctus]